MQLGVIGLGTMGANLARNAARNGAKVVVYNRTQETMKLFLEQHGTEGKIAGTANYEEFIAALKSPRTILIMVKAGAAVDAVIEELLPHLKKGDILIDGGNSHFPDTNRRAKELMEREFKYLGLGVSGGEEGALNGPSLMAGGDNEAYKAVEKLFSKMAADDGEGGKCLAYLGPDGAGHFVKMVHNGIEYAVMQLMAESYHILKEVGGFTNEDLAETFEAWNQGEDLSSYLAEITTQIFRKKDDQGAGDLIDAIKDAAGQKGTGKWTTETAMNYGVAVPTITAAVDSRIVSGSSDLRARRKDLPAELDTHDPVPRPMQLRSTVRSAMELASICAYAQGFELMKTVSEVESWNIPLSEVARIWRGGCIIRSILLKRLQKAFSKNTSAAQAATDTIKERYSGERQLNWRRAVVYGVSRGIPLPTLSASLAYFDALRHERLPQNLIQAQRDYFGAHKYERLDSEGEYHTDWNS